MMFMGREMLFLLTCYAGVRSSVFPELSRMCISFASRMCKAALTIFAHRGRPCRGRFLSASDDLTRLEVGDHLASALWQHGHQPGITLWWLKRKIGRSRTSHPTPSLSPVESARNTEKLFTQERSDCACGVDNGFRGYG